MQASVNRRASTRSYHPSDDEKRETTNNGVIITTENLAKEYVTLQNLINTDQMPTENRDGKHQPLSKFLLVSKIVLKATLMYTTPKSKDNTTGDKIVAFARLCFVSIAFALGVIFAIYCLTRKLATMLIHI
jgi:hypothetical protein